MKQHDAPFEKYSCRLGPIDSEYTTVPKKRKPLQLNNLHHPTATKSLALLTFGTTVANVGNIPAAISGANSPICITKEVSHEDLQRSRAN